MQGEPTATQAAQAGGALGWIRGSGATAWRARLAKGAALLAPIALVVGLALAGGGFDLGERHLAGLAVWLVVVALLVLGAATSATAGRPLYWSLGLLGSLALWSALSSFWSGSVELSVIEADRVLAYLGVFLAAFLIAQTAERRQRFAEGLTIALVAVAFLALASRLLPDLTGVDLGGPRLRYPLGYWNANGAMFGMAIALLLWSSRHATWRALRWVSLGAMPSALLALYFTYSRGGLLVLVVGAICLLALSADRLWLLGYFAASLLATLPAVLAVQARRELADGIPGQAIVDQGVTVLLILAAGTVFALLAFAALRRAEERAGPLINRALAASRDPRLLRGVAIAAGVVAVVAAISVGGRAWDRFSSPDIYFPEQPEQHFGQLSGAGRHDFWRVSVDTFADRPVLGTGAGAYEYAWESRRSIDMAIHDAHSIYLEAFAELGVLGGLLVLALIGFLLASAFAAWRGAQGGERSQAAVLLAVMLAFAVGAAFDWFWELHGLGVVFFLAAGVAVAARCAQRGEGPPPAERSREGRRFGLAIVGLGLAWLSAVALIGPLLVEREIEASQAAAAEGKLGDAFSHADNARDIEPWAASPYLQLGLLAELQGDNLTADGLTREAADAYQTAIARLGQAIEREDRSWQLYFLRSRAESKAGLEDRAAADLERARELNPLAPELQADEQ